jgi:hypothetical protein
MVELPLDPTDPLDPLDPTDPTDPTDPINKLLDPCPDQALVNIPRPLPPS